MRLVSTSAQGKPIPFFRAMQDNTAKDGFCYIPDPVACFRDISQLLDLNPQARQQQILQRLLDDEWQDGLQHDLAWLHPQTTLHKLRNRLYLFEAFHGESLTDRDLGARLWVSMMALHLKASSHVFHGITMADDAGLALAHALADHSSKEGLHLTLVIAENQNTWADRARINRLCQGHDTHVRMFKVKTPFEQLQAQLRQNKWPDPLHIVDGRNIAFALGDVLNAFEALAQLRAQDHRSAPVLSLPWTEGHLIFGLLWAKEMGLPVKALSPTLALSQDAPNLDEAMKNRLDPRLQAWSQLHTGFIKGLRLTGIPETTIRQAQWELHMDGCLSDPGTALAYAGLESKRGLGETALVWASRHPLLDKEHIESRMNLSLDPPEGYESNQGNEGSESNEDNDAWEHIPWMTGGVETWMEDLMRG